MFPVKAVIVLREYCRYIALALFVKLGFPNCGTLP